MSKKKIITSDLFTPRKIDSRVKESNAYIASVLKNFNSIKHKLIVELEIKDKYKNLQQGNVGHLESSLIKLKILRSEFSYEELEYIYNWIDFRMGPIPVNNPLQDKERILVEINGYTFIGFHIEDVQGTSEEITIEFITIRWLKNISYEELIRTQTAGRQK